MEANEPQADLQSRGLTKEQTRTWSKPLPGTFVTREFLSGASARLSTLDAADEALPTNRRSHAIENAIRIARPPRGQFAGFSKSPWSHISGAQNHSLAQRAVGRYGRIRAVARQALHPYQNDDQGIRYSRQLARSDALPPHYPPSLCGDAGRRPGLGVVAEVRRRLEARLPLWAHAMRSVSAVLSALKRVMWSRLTPLVRVNLRPDADLDFSCLAVRIS